MPRNPDLEARILSDPTDVDAYRVYADWLHGAGDPRGELIVLHLEMAQRFLRRVDDHFEGVGPVPPGSSYDETVGSVAERERACFEANRDAFLGELALYGDAVRITWHLGFIRSAAVGVRVLPNAARVMQALLRSESSPFLINLSLLRAAEALWDVLVEEGRPTHLKSLFATGIALDDRRADALYDALPTLEQLELRATDAGLGTLRLPRLRSLVLQVDRGENEVLSALTRAEVPALQRLSVAFPPGATEPLDAAPSHAERSRPALEWLLEGEGVPALRHLEVHHTQSVGGLLRQLVTSPLLAQLDTLEVSGPLDEDTALYLGRNADAFAHLQSCQVEPHDARGLSQNARSGLWFLQFDQRLATRPE